MLAVDLCGPFPKTEIGNTQILMLTDHFTRWSDAIPITDGKADTVAKALDERISTYWGIPEEIHTDQGRQFEYLKNSVNSGAVKRHAPVPTDHKETL